MVKYNDLYTSTQQIGNMWRGVLRLPWWSKAKMVEVNGEVQRFSNQAEASQAASDALCHEFRNKTTGWRDGGPNNTALKELELLFGGGDE